MILPMVPILYLATPLIAGVLLGPVYMLFTLRVPRAGAVLILSILVGLITSMVFFYPLIAAVIWGVIAEVVLMGKRSTSSKALIGNYCVFNLPTVVPFFSMFLAKDAFLATLLFVILYTPHTPSFKQIKRRYSIN